MLIDLNDGSEEWFPYPSKLVFLLDTISNLPRLRISSSFMKALLWMLGELGIKKVPSYEALKSIQKHVRENVGIPTTQHQSPKGNVFSFNDPSALIAKVSTQISKINKPAHIIQDWADPLVCGQIRRYPVIPSNGVVSEIWHARKWRHDLDRHILSPMYDDEKGRHYFIDEPACLENGTMVIPVRWLEDEKGVVWAEAWEVRRNEGTVRTSQLYLSGLGTHGKKPNTGNVNRR